MENYRDSNGTQAHLTVHGTHRWAYENDEEVVGTVAGSTGRGSRLAATQRLAREKLVGIWAGHVGHVIDLANKPVALLLIFGAAKFAGAQALAAQAHACPLFSLRDAGQSQQRRRDS
jgi:hypothetical protein